MADLTVDDAPTLRRCVAELDESIGKLTEARYQMWQMMMDARNVSPAGDRRERQVPCSMCRRPTLALEALCDECWLAMDAPEVGF